MDHTARNYNRIQHQVAVGQLEANPNEAGTVRKVQISTHVGQMLQSDVHDVQFYGFASSPLPGCNLAVHSIHGDRNGAFTLGSNDTKYRPTYLVPGECVLHDNANNRVYIKQGKIVQIDAVESVIVNAPTVTINAQTAVNVTTPTMTLNGDLEVKGKIHSTNDTIAGSISLQQHRHSGVQAGGGSTGTPT